MKMINFKSKRNLILIISLLVAIIFSIIIINIVKSATPNPGHSSTEIDFRVVIKNTNSTLAIDDTVVLADASAGPITLTLPSASANPDLLYIIKKIDSSLSNIVTISPQTGQTIDGFSQIRLVHRGETVVLQSDGSNWQILNRQPYDVYAFRTKGTTLNQWYTSPNTGTALTTGAPSANYLRAIPFIVSRPITIDAMAINVTTAATGYARVGIYRDNGNNYPGQLVVDAGQADTSATGVKTFTANLPVTLEPGLYWLAIVSNAAPTIRAFAVGSLIPVLGYTSALGTAASFGWSVSYTYGALPATFPSGGSVITATPIPAIFVRVSQ